MGDKPEDPTDWAPGQPPPTLASRGYEYVPGPTGDRSDWVLRKIADGTPFASCKKACNRLTCTSAKTRNRFKSGPISI